MSQTDNLHDHEEKKNIQKKKRKKKQIFKI